MADAIELVASIVTVAIIATIGLTLVGFTPPKAASEPVLHVDGLRVALNGAALKGSRNARVVMIEYADFGCSFCGRFARETLPIIEAEYVNSGEVLFAFETVAVGTRSPAMKAAQAAACAGQQGMFWAAHDRFFRLSDPPSDEIVAGIVKDLGLNAEMLASCSAATVEENVARNLKFVKSLGLSGTPSFYFGFLETDGSARLLQAFTGARAVDVFRGILDTLLGAG